MTISSARHSGVAIAVDELAPSAPRGGPARSPARRSASSASRYGAPSPAGEAVQMLPTSVPRFWICTPPISRAASFRPSNSGGSVGAASDRSRSSARRCASAPPPRRCRASPAWRVMSRMSAWRMSPQPTRAALRRIDVGAAGQHRHRLARRGSPGLPRASRGGNRRPSLAPSRRSLRAAAQRCRRRRIDLAVRRQRHAEQLARLLAPCSSRGRTSRATSAGIARERIAVAAAARRHHLDAVAGAQRDVLVLGQVLRDERRRRRGARARRWARRRRRPARRAGRSGRGP